MKKINKNKQCKKISFKNNKLKKIKKIFREREPMPTNPHVKTESDMSCLCCGEICNQQGNHYSCSNCDHLYKKWDKDLDQYYKKDFRRQKPFKIDKNKQQKTIRLRCVKKLSDILQKWLTESDKVLEIGCGDGLLAESIYNKVSNVSICDLDKSVIKIGEDISCKSYCSSIFDLDDTKYDVCLAFDLIEHIDDIIAFREKLNIICIKYFIVSIPHPNRRVQYSKKFVPHVQEFSKKSLVKLFDRWEVKEKQDVSGIAGGLSYFVVFENKSCPLK